MHHAVLYPADKQLGIRFVAGETADVVTDVEQPGQAHPQPHAGVEAQGVPTCAVIAAPGLHVALHPGAAGTGDEIWALLRGETLLRFQRGAHHQQRHHRANMLDSDFLAEAMAARFAVPHFKLVVVVPGRVDPHLQQLRGDAFLPPLDSLRVGKVEVRAFVIPEAGTFWCIAFGIANKQAAFCYFVITRVILQQARFDIGRQFQPRVVERLAHHLRLRHFVVVPVKDVTLAVDRGVTGRELERVAWNSVFCAQADEVHQLVLRVRCVGVVHGRATVAQAPFWSEQRFAGQTDKGFGDVQHSLAGKDVVINITRFRLPAAIGGVVVIDFVTQIQPATAQVVVEQAVAHIMAMGDSERDVLVQRVSAGCVIAHRIEVAHLITFTVALQIARFLTQAVETLILTAAEIVRHAVAVCIQQVGAGGAVIDQRLPLARLIAVVPLQPQRLVDGHAQPFGCHG